MNVCVFIKCFDSHTTKICVFRDTMETEPSQAAIGADDEVMNHAFKLRAINEGNV